MFRSIQAGSFVFSILAPFLLTACGSPVSPAAARATSAATVSSATVVRPPRAFTINTPVERIAADPQGKAVLVRDVPGLMSNKDYPLFDDMSLTEIALLSRGQLSKSKLDLVQTDLIQLSDNQ